jgi:DNA-binding NtrC family response regulator
MTRSRGVLYQRAAAVFLVGSQVSRRPIDPARVNGVSLVGTKLSVWSMKKLIAIVDDDKAVGDALQRMLQTHGFATAVFASAEEFLSRAKAHRAACLILDVRMPGMTGVALHNYLVGKGFRIPTILITACPTRREERRAIANGVASYLAKPLHEQLLLDTIRGVLEDGGEADGGASFPLEGPRVKPGHDE